MGPTDRGTDGGKDERTNGRTDEWTNGRTDQPKVVQEVLADLKRERKKWVTFAYGPQPPLTVSLTVKYLFFTTSLSDLVNFPRKLCLKLS